MWSFFSSFSASVLFVVMLPGSSLKCGEELEDVSFSFWVRNVRKRLNLCFSRGCFATDGVPGEEASCFWERSERKLLLFSSRRDDDMVLKIETSDLKRNRLRDVLTFVASLLCSHALPRTDTARKEGRENFWINCGFVLLMSYHEMRRFVTCAGHTLST